MAGSNFDEVFRTTVPTTTLLNMPRSNIASDEENDWHKFSHAEADSNLGPEAIKENKCASIEHISNDVHFRRKTLFVRRCFEERAYEIHVDSLLILRNK